MEPAKTTTPRPLIIILGDSVVFNSSKNGFINKLVDHYLGKADVINRGFPFGINSKDIIQHVKSLKEQYSHPEQKILWVVWFQTNDFGVYDNQEVSDVTPEEFITTVTSITKIIKPNCFTNGVIPLPSEDPSIVKTFLEENKNEIILVTPTPIDNEKWKISRANITDESIRMSTPVSFSTYDRIGQFSRAVVKFGFKLDIPVIDLLLNIDLPWSELYVDGVHLSPEGHEILHEKILNTIAEKLPLWMLEDNIVNEESTEKKPVYSPYDWTRTEDQNTNANIDSDQLQEIQKAYTLLYEHLKDLRQTKHFFIAPTEEELNEEFLSPSKLFIHAKKGILRNHLRQHLPNAKKLGLLENKLQDMNKQKCKADEVMCMDDAYAAKSSPFAKPLSSGYTCDIVGQKFSTENKKNPTESETLHQLELLLKNQFDAIVSATNALIHQSSDSLSQANEINLPHYEERPIRVSEGNTISSGYENPMRNGTVISGSAFPSVSTAAAWGNKPNGSVFSNRTNNTALQNAGMRQLQLKNRLDPLNHNRGSMNDTVVVTDSDGDSTYPTKHRFDGKNVNARRAIDNLYSRGPERNNGYSNDIKSRLSNKK